MPVCQPGPAAGCGQGWQQAAGEGALSTSTLQVLRGVCPTLPAAWASHLTGFSPKAAGPRAVVHITSQNSIARDGLVPICTCVTQAEAVPLLPRKGCKTI